MSANPRPGSQNSIRASQRSGIEWSRRRYSISVPGPMAIGCGVITLKCSQGGVIASRFKASAKNANASPVDTGSSCSVSSCRRPWLSSQLASVRVVIAARDPLDELGNARRA
ncbi:MAG TPA: hypothetical protein VE780_17770 [Thermoleophilaceae bacterium]|nr:hypothetical protein [Thermoleophilaceae bacterium]